MSVITATADVDASVINRSLPAWPVQGRDEAYRIQRIFCVGRNYAAHAREMDRDPDREPPFFFTKFAEAYAPSGAAIAYPPETQNYHYEVELVVALSGGGARIPAEQARQHIFGYAVGLDMTRRDLQLEARGAGRPWDTGKNFEQSAPMGPLVPASAFPDPNAGRISLEVNGAVKQDSDLAKLIWPVDDVIACLSQLYTLRDGDVIMTGTPEGVGPVQRGDVLTGRIEGLPEVQVSIV